MLRLIGFTVLVIVLVWWFAKNYNDNHPAT